MYGSVHHYWMMCVPVSHLHTQTHTQTHVCRHIHKETNTLIQIQTHTLTYIHTQTTLRHSHTHTACPPCGGDSTGHNSQGLTLRRLSPKKAISQPGHPAGPNRTLGQEPGLEPLWLPVTQKPRLLGGVRGGCPVPACRFGGSIPSPLCQGSCFAKGRNRVTQT